MKTKQQHFIMLAILGTLLLATFNAFAVNSSIHQEKQKEKPKVVIPAPVDAIGFSYTVDPAIGACSGSPTILTPTTVTRTSSTPTSDTYVFSGGLNATATVSDLYGFGSLPYMGTTNTGVPIAVFNQARSVGLTYSDFGWWNTSTTNANGLPVDTIGYFGSGPTANLTTAMPKTGSAIYSGVFIGDAYDGTSRFQLVGYLGLTASFSAASVKGQINNISAYTTSWPGITTTYNDINLSGKIAGNGFSGSATASSMSGTSGAPTNSAALPAGTTGTFNGHFYGPTANEITGVMQINSGLNKAGGSFGAKQ